MFGRDAASFRAWLALGKRLRVPQTLQWIRCLRGHQRYCSSEALPASYVQRGTNYGRGVASLHSLVSLRPPPVLS